MKAYRRYLRDVARLLPYGGRAKRAYMKNLRRDVTEFRQEHPDCTYGALEQRFGTAKALAAYVLEETDKVALASMFRLNRGLIYGGLAVVAAASIVTAAASVQRAMMFYDFTHGYIKEEIYGPEYKPPVDDSEIVYATSQNPQFTPSPGISSLEEPR